MKRVIQTLFGISLFMMISSISLANLTNVKTVVLTGTSQISASTDDNAVSNNNSMQWVGYASHRLGTNKYTCAIIPFQLPVLVAGEEISTASFTTNLIGLSGNLADAVDLYATAYDASSAVAGTDYFGGAYDSDANAIALQQGFFNSTSTVGAQSSDASANSALATFLNAQYANGAVGGDYIFIRLSMDSNSGSNYNYWDIGSQDNTTAGNRPILTVDIQNAAPSNTAPVVAAMSAQSVEEGASINVAISATDADGDSMTLSASSLPSFAIFTDNGDGTGTVAISPVTDDAGSYNNITITANDGTDTGSNSFDLSVTAPAGNAAPVLAAIGNQSVYEDNSLDIAISATDADGDALTITASGLPSFAALTDNGNGTASIAVSPLSGDTGSYGSIVVSVSDGTVSTSETISITVSVVPTGTVYYLDPVNGDMANDGSQGSPWASLASVVYIAPTIADGATLYLMDGNHGTPYVQNYTFASGITVTPLSGHNPVVTSISLNNCTNWTFDGVMFDGTTSTLTKDGVLVSGDANSTYITLKNCTVQSAESSSTWTKTDWYANVKSGLQFRAGNITVENTTIKNIYHAMEFRGDNCLVTGNLIDNFAGDAIRGLGSFSTYEYNVVRDCYIDDYSIQHDDGFQTYNLEADPKTEGVILRFNKFLLFEDPITQFVIDNSLIGTLMQGIIVTDGYADSWVVENNLVVNTQAHGISLYGARNCKVQNNTVVQHPYFTDTTVPRIYLDDQGKTGQTNFNNVIRNNIAGQFTDWTFDATSTVQNNVDITTNVANYAPYFADYANMDFHLKAGSGAIDAGVNTDLTATDLDGNARIADGTVDAGAYEFNSGTGGNARPVLAAIGSAQLNEENTVTKTLSATDADGDALTFSVSNLPSFATLTDNGDGSGSIAINPEAGDEGTYNITVSVTDGTDADTEDVTITINPIGGANNAPSITTISNQNLEEGSSVTVNVTATDSDGDAITMTATSLPSYAVFTDNGDGTGSVVISPLTGDAGSVTATLSATDGTDTGTKNFAINVSAPGQSNGSTYYVDPVAGNNSNDGSQGSPWSSIQPTSIQNGDLVYLLDGNHGVLYIGNMARTEDVTFKALSGHTPVFTKVTIDNSQHLVFDGITIDATNSGLSKLESMLTGNAATTHITIKNSLLKGVDDISTYTKNDWYANVCSGMQFRGDNITIDNTTILNTYMAVELRGDNSYMVNNLIDNFAGDAIRGLGSFSTYEYNTVRDCYIDDYAIQHDDAFQAYELTGDLKIENVTIRHNKFLLFEDPITQFVIDNELIGSLMQGVIITDGYADGWVVENNLVMNDQTHGITLYGARNCRIQNNTVVQHPYYTDTDLVPWIACLAQGKTGQDNFNNIIRNNVGAKYTTWTFDATSTVENNIDIDELDYNNYLPYFQDYVNHDFRLKAGSLAIDAGVATDLSSLDLDGNARVFGPAPDAGCFEYSAAADSQAPSFATTNNTFIDDVFTFSFSESVTPATAQEVSNYSINNGVTVTSATLQGDNRSVVMYVSTLGGNQVNTLTASNIEDYAGNVISAGNTGTFKFNCDTLWASTFQDDQWGYNPPAGAMDGDLNTKWSADGVEWLQKNFCSPVTVTSVDMAFEVGDERTYDFSIEVSNDGVNYTEVFNGTSSGTTLALENFNFADVQIRYVKIIGGGNSASTWNNYQEVVINTTGGVPSNNAPIVASIVTQSVQEGNSLNVAVSGTDNDGDALTLSASSLPSFATFTDNGDGTGTVAIVSSVGDVGSYTGITITANDGSDTGSTSFDLAVTAAPVNNAPVLAAIGDQTLHEDATLNVAISATDTEGDALTLSATGLPSFALLTDNGDGTGTLAINPSAGDVGTYSNIVVSISDGTDSASETISITVDAVVEPGETSSASWQNFSMDSYSATFTAEYDAVPHANNMDGVTAILKGSASQYNDLAVIVRFNTSGVIDMRDGNSYKNDVAVAYSAGTSYHFRLEVDVANHTFDVFVTPTGQGETQIANDYAFRVSQKNVNLLNAWAMIAESDTHTVSNMTFSDVSTPAPNNAPVLSAIGDQGLGEDASLNITLSATDTDGDALTISVTGLPSFAVLTDNGDGTGIIAVNPTSGDAGTYANVVVSVSDGTNTASENITITVNAVVASETFTVYAHADDQEIRSNGSAQWVGQNPNRVGGGGSGYDAAMIMPFQLPALPVGQEVATAAMSLNLVSIANSPTGNINLSGIGYRSTSAVQTADYSASSTVLEVGVATAATAAGNITISNDHELADFINAQYAAGAVAGDYIFLKIASDVDEANFFYWNFNSGDDASDANKPTLTIESGDGSDGRVQGAGSVLAIERLSTQFSVYPNPSEGGNFYLSIPNDFNLENGMISIFDGTGRLMIAERLDKNQQLHQYQVKRSMMLNRGYYIVMLSNGSANKSIRLIIK